jgi:hypothetical protein
MRLHGSLDDQTPIEFEHVRYATSTESRNRMREAENLGRFS